MNGPVHIPDSIIEAALEEWHAHLWETDPPDQQRAAMRDLIEAAFHSICDANADSWSKERE